MTARTFNALVAVWIFISAFAWPHTAAQRLSTALCGLAAFGLASATTRHDAARYLNMAVGVWLFLSAFLLPGIPQWKAATMWNNVIFGLVLFATALLGATVEHRRGEDELYGGA
jgi:hypothetical protein